MNENLVVIPFAISDPDESAGVTTGAEYIMLPITGTIVYVQAAPFEDDSGATLDILDDGTDIITGIDVSDHDVPGEWISTHMDGANAPVEVAAGSKLSIDINAGAVANRFSGYMLVLTGAGYG